MVPVVLAAVVGVLGTVLAPVPGVFGTVLGALPGVLGTVLPGTAPVLPFLAVGTGCFVSPPFEELVFFTFSASASAAAGFVFSSLVGFTRSDFFLSSFASAAGTSSSLE